MMIRIILFEEKTGNPATDNAARNLNRSISKSMHCLVTASHRIPRKRKQILKHNAVMHVMVSLTEKIKTRGWKNFGY